MGYRTKFQLWLVTQKSDRSGASTGNRLRFVREKLRKTVDNQCSYIIYLWTGTCDLTYKSRGLSYLKSDTVDNNESVSNLIDLFREFKSFCKTYRNVDILILESPPYSIYQYNTRTESLGEEQDNRFKSQDKILAKQVASVNKQIREINGQDNLVSPTFKHDVVSNRKSANRQAYESFNYKLSLDGIHPDTLLSQVWMRRILIQMYVNCY